MTAIPFSQQPKDLQKKIAEFEAALHPDSVEAVRRIYARVAAEVAMGILSHKEGDAVRKVIDSGLREYREWLMVRWPVEFIEQIQNILDKRDRATLTICEQLMTPENFKKFKAGYPSHARIDRP